MKKFTKIALIIAGVLFSIGIVSGIVAISMGLTWDSLSDMVKEDKFNFTFDIDDSIEDYEDSKNALDVDSSFHNIDIEFGSGVLKLVPAKQSGLTVQHSSEHYKCFTKDGTFYIKPQKGFNFNHHDEEVIVTVPEDIVLNEIDLEIGAGKVEMSNISAQSFEIEVGAGEANLTNIDVEEFDAKVGAGKLYTKLQGSQTDYNYEAEYGIGSLAIGNTSLNGLGGEKDVTNPGAKKHLDLECGIGEIKIEFTQ